MANLAPTSNDLSAWEADLYYSPAYSVVDAARYLRIPTATLRNWLRGNTQNTKQGQQSLEPLIQRPDLGTPKLSFVNLVEVHVLRIVREIHRIKLDKVRKSLTYISQQLKTEHPLVYRQFQTDGIDLFVEQMDRLVNVSRSGQLAMKETLKHLLTRVEWGDRDIAVRLFPFVHPAGDDTKILYIDPRISFGKPVIAGKGIPTDAIADLYEAGDELEDIAYEFDCTLEQVKAAIQFESLSLAA